MFCSQCGERIEEGSAFCPMCGTDLKSAETEEDAPSPAPPPPPSPPVQTPPPPPPPQSPAAPVTPPPAPAPAQPVQPTAPMPHVVPAAAAIAGGAAVYPKGPLGGRFLALVADSIIASALLPLGILLLVAAAAADRAPIAGVFVTILAVLWQIGYSFGRDAAGGAGFGKRLTGIVVVTEEGGTPAPAGPAIVRQVVLWALGLIPAVGSLIEPIMVLVDKDGRRIGDKAAKTRVVRSADVAAAGIPAPTGKGAAVAVLVAALLVSLIGSTIGGVVLARSIQDGAGGWESVVDDPPSGWDVAPAPEPPATQPQDDMTPPGDDIAPPAEPEPPADEPISGFSQESSVEAVGEMLYALQNDDVERARGYASRSFQEYYDGFFEPLGGVLFQFEVVDVYRDAALWVVVMEEQWNSGPERVHYFVTEEDGMAKVDGMMWEDDL